MNAQEVINELKKGDERLLARIYVQYRNAFITYAAGRYKMDTEVLKEIYQDVIMAFYNNIRDGKLLKLTCSIKSYLFEIGIHMVCKELRNVEKDFNLKQKIRRKELRPFLEDDDSEYRIMLFRLVKSELETIGEKCAQLLKMFYFERLRMEEIASALNFSNVDSAKTQKYKCFEKLKASVMAKYNFINFY
jgi:RNA polymerase sigma factor (sigma-70 family)